MPGPGSSDFLELLDFSDEASRELLSLPLEVRERFFAAFPDLAAHPHGVPNRLNVENLHDEHGRRTRYWRLKFPGGYRAIYRVVQGRVRIDAIRPRPGAYAWVSKVLGHRS